MIKIDKGIPAPTARSGGPNARYPWNDLEVGDSFLMPVGKKFPCGSAVHYQKRTGAKIVRRTTPEGIRVWRIA